MTSLLYGFRPAPTYRGASPTETFEAALDMPLSRTSTFFDQAKGGILESFGLGTGIRDVTTPEGDVERDRTDLNEAFGLVTNPLIHAYRVTKDIAQSFINEDESPTLSEDAYKASAWFREGVQWDSAMTEQRAAALAESFDAKKVREFYSSKRPITAFIGNLAGQATDPINYVPVAGPAVRAAAVARLGKVGGASVAASLDAAANTAIFGLATSKTRARLGDDVSWQATVSQIATAALIGAGFGAIGGALSKSGNVSRQAIEERLATLKTTQEARIALNEGIDALVHGEDVRLSPNATEPLARVASEIGRLPQIENLTPESFYRPANRSFDEIYAGASKRQADFDSFGRQIADELGIEFRTQGKPKDRATAEAKVARKGYASPSHVTDINRGGFIVDGPEKADSIIAKLTSSYDVLDEGWVRTDAGYIDRKLLIRYPDGSIGEVQLWDRAMLEAKKAGGGHALYKKRRELDPKSPEAQELQAQMQRLYAEASARSPGDWSSIGGASLPKLLNRSRQSASGMTAPVSNTSQKSALTQAELGSSIANASELPSTAGRASQLMNRMEGSFARSVDTSTPVPELPPEGAAEAAKQVGKPDTLKAMSEQYGVDLATGDFAEMVDIDQLRLMGRLTPEDEAALADAAEQFEAAEAYGNTLKAAAFCLS